MKQCPNCKQLYADDILYCLSDGTVLAAQKPVATAAAAPKNPVWIYAAGSVAVLVVAAVIVFALISRSNDKTSHTESVKSSESEKTRVSSNKTNDTKITNKSEQSTGNQSERSDIIEKQSEKSNIIENQTSADSRKSNLSSAITPVGKWKGKWTASLGSSFNTELILTDEGGGKIGGKLIWTLRETINPKKIEKIGQSATEYVEGSYDAATRKLNLSGYDKDDPYELINLDDYYLTLSINNKRLEGVAQSRGRLDGRFALTRY